MCFFEGCLFLLRRGISTEEAYFYGEGRSLRKRRNSEDEINFKTIGLLLVETALFYIVKLWHSATVIKLLFRFSNLPPFSIFISQHLLKGVIKSKSSSVINTLSNRGFFSRVARSIFDHRPKSSTEDTSGPITSDQIVFCAFHSFLVEVQKNAGYGHATHAQQQPGDYD